MGPQPLAGWLIEWNRGGDSLGPLSWWLGYGHRNLRPWPGRLAWPGGGAPFLYHPAYSLTPDGPASGGDGGDAAHLGDQVVPSFCCGLDYRIIGLEHAI